MKGILYAALIVGTLIITSGCATQDYWTTSTKSGLDFVKDNHECRQLADEAYPGDIPGGVGVVVAVVSKNRREACYYKCMKVRDWKLATHR